MLTYYCWQCYGENPRCGGICTKCGGRIEAPAGTPYVDLLLWALGHPLAERQMTAARVLGELREPRASAALRELAIGARDPYLAAQALESLIAIEGPDSLVALLCDRVVKGPIPVRRVAERGLSDSRRRGRHQDVRKPPPWTQPPGR
jgi:hypothetical protein